MRATPQRPRGFTLLELMLAILLLALLLSGTYGAIRTAVKAMHSGEVAIDRTNRVRAAEEFLRRQVGRIMPLSFGTDDSTNTNVVFEGDGKFMRFVAPMPGYLSKGGPYVQTLEITRGPGGGQLVFGNDMLNGFDPSGKSQNEPVVLLDQIQEAHFQYRTLDENGELTDWFDDWEDPGVTPVMIRIAVNMRPEARVSFPEMDIPLILDVGAMRVARPGQMMRGAGLQSGSGRLRSPGGRR